MKFCGKIGYVETVETEPGVWEEQITERTYFGDVTRKSSALQNSGDINDNVNISQQIRIVTNPYGDMKFHSLRYVEFMGTKWKISNIEVQYPELVLTLGGVYNGE